MTSEQHLVQITANAQTIANCEAPFSQAAYEINSQHGWSIRQIIGTSDLMLTVTFGNEAEAISMEQSVETQCPSASVGRVSLRHNAA